MAKPLLYTKEELIGILISKQKKLGRKPKKSDMSDVLKVQYRKAFGKWCYALEAAGLSVPSERVLARRQRQKLRHRKRRRTPCTYKINANLKSTLD